MLMEETNFNVRHASERKAILICHVNPTFPREINLTDMLRHCITSQPSANEKSNYLIFRFVMLLEEGGLTSSAFLEKEMRL